MMPRHTAGPWIARYGRTFGEYVVADLLNGVFVVPAARQPLGDWVADAHLIAAAPSMLAALVGLEHILATAESNASGREHFEAISARIEAARMAIAIATGWRQSSDLRQSALQDQEDEAYRAEQRG